MAPALAVAGVGQALVFGSLFRLVLADVPNRHAGVGGGVLVTIQQSGLALGVATLGTLYLGLETHGISQAFAAATAAQIAIMAVLAIASRAVPHAIRPTTKTAVGRLSQPGLQSVTEASAVSDLEVAENG
jgi:hypothetical protein